MDIKRRTIRWAVWLSDGRIVHINAADVIAARRMVDARYGPDTIIWAVS